MFSPRPTPVPKPAPKPARFLLPTAAAVAIVAAIAWAAGGSSGDTPMTEAELMARSVAFNQAVPVVVRPVPATERPAALQMMKLPAEQQTELEKQRVELVYLTLWDDHTEDGDTVTIDSDGFRQSITLQNTPVTIALPRPRSSIITMTGIYDGGGGITVAVSSGAGSIPVPRLSVGQSIGVPVR